MATVRLRCDGTCGTERQGQPGVTIGKLREMLAKIGWVSTGGSPGRDVCPSCLHRGVIP
jgi:hypothetical protein